VPLSILSKVIPAREESKPPWWVIAPRMALAPSNFAFSINDIGFDAVESLLKPLDTAAGTSIFNDRGADWARGLVRTAAFRRDEIRRHEREEDMQRESMAGSLGCSQAYIYIHTHINCLEKHVTCWGQEAPPLLTGGPRRRLVRRRLSE